jgi:hypothetical protein
MSDSLVRQKHPVGAIDLEPVDEHFHHSCERVRYPPEWWWGPRFKSASLLRVNTRLFTHYAVALTSEPDERSLRKLSNARWAELTLPELSADPICESKLENDVGLELLEVPVELVDALLEEELSVEFSSPVSES